MMRQIRALCALLAIGTALLATAAGAAEPGDVVLPVPQRTQADGTVWASSNCGPAAISEVLEAFGQKLPTKVLRDRANQLLGIADPNTGTRVQDLAQVVREHGLAVTGPYDGKRFRRWTLDDVRAEIQAGHPVVAQVYYPLLPNHSKSGISTDHYIVLMGTSGDGFIFNDSADRDAPGYRQPITAAQLTKAWGSSHQPFGGFSVAPGEGSPSLLPPMPEPSPTPDAQDQGAPADSSPASANAPIEATGTVGTAALAPEVPTMPPTQTQAVASATPVPTETPTPTVPVASATPTPTKIAPAPAPTATATPSAQQVAQSIQATASPSKAAGQQAAQGNLISQLKSGLANQ